jgi:electron transfer flavoprotein alpha subunit
VKETKEPILVYLELPDGVLDETGKGLLSYVSRLAQVAEADWNVVTCSEVKSQCIDILSKYGTPAITILRGGENIFDQPTLIGDLLAQFALAERQQIIVLPQNDLGATIAPIVAAKLDAAIITEVTAVSRHEDQIRLSRNTLGNRIVETRIWNATHPLVITVPLSSLSTVILSKIVRTTPTLNEWKGEIISSTPTPMIIKRDPPDPKTVDLTEAEVIICLGKGCDKKDFDQMQKLCQLLNVSLGVTRPIYDMGWTGFERMIGQTGKTIAPRLYLAFGVSGSMHHVGGIKDSRRVICLNVDTKAPIFPNSDEGFVANVKEVLPLLLKKAETMKGGAS